MIADHGRGVATPLNKNSMFFNKDRTIRKVTRTLRGVGVTDASGKIQIDMYSYKSNGGASIAFLDTSDTFRGWKTILDSADAWIQHSSVNFGNSKLGSVEIRAFSKSGDTIQIRLDEAEGPLILGVEIPKRNEWKIINASLSVFHPGMHNLIVQLKDSGNVETDWTSFE